LNEIEWIFEYKDVPEKTNEVGCDQIKGQGICLMGAVEEDKRDKGKLESMTKTK
jgi:hypothetical protein